MQTDEAQHVYRADLPAAGPVVMPLAGIFIRPPMSSTLISGGLTIVFPQPTSVCDSHASTREGFMT
jgi:hypothetical protein